MLRRISLFACFLLAGCPTANTGPENSSGGGGGGQVGSPCSADTDCVSNLCVGGVCGGQASSSSGGSSSGGTADAGSSSGGVVDAGTADAAVPAGHIVLDPDGSMGPLEFGATRIGVAVTKNVLVTNTGVAPASIIALSFRNNPSGEFTLSVVGGQPAALMPQQQITLRITHTAVDALADNAFLSVVTNAENSLVELPLLAQFKGNPTLLVADAVASNNDVTQFQVPPTPVGTPVVAHLYVKNLGANDSALTVSSVTLNPAVSPLFSVSAGMLPRSVSSFPGLCTDLGGCAPGAASCTGGLCLAPAGHPMDLVDIELTFNAGAAGAAATELVIVADVGGTATTRRIPVVALGQDSRVDVTPNPVAFGNVFVGRSANHQVTIMNPADASNVLELTSLGIRFTPSPYAVDLGGITFPYPLTPGSSVVIAVSFAPTNAGSFNNSLAVGRSVGLPIYIPITAAGVLPPHADIPSALPFGGAIPGTPRSLPLTIGNTGNGPLSVTSLSVTPPTAPFSVALMSLPDIAAGGSTTVQVTYSPAHVGDSDAATLLVATNDPDQPLIQVALTGTGVSPGAQVTPESGVDFGSVLIGSNPAPTRTITVANTGSGSLQVSSPSVVKDTLNVPITQYTVTPSRPLPAMVTSGDSMTFTLTFAPAASVAYPGSIVINTNDASHPTYTIPVTGSGNNCAPLPNTTVNVVNGTQCAYACVANAVSCSDMSCVACPVRHGANPSCAAGHACQYTCPANTGELQDPPNACNVSTARNLGNIQGDAIFFGGGNPVTTTSFRIYPAGDEDWFKFKMVDRQDILDGAFLATIRSQVTLTGVAPGEQLGFEVIEGSCTGGGTPAVVHAGEAVTVETRAFCDTATVNNNGTPNDTSDDYTVPFDDSVWFYIHVYPMGDSYQCTSYSLYVETFEELLSGFCF